MFERFSIGQNLLENYKFKKFNELILKPEFISPSSFRSMFLLKLEDILYFLWKNMKRKCIDFWQIFSIMKTMKWIEISETYWTFLRNKKTEYFSFSIVNLYLILCWKLLINYIMDLESSEWWVSKVLFCIQIVF